MQHKKSGTNKDIKKLIQENTEGFNLLLLIFRRQEMNLEAGCNILSK